MKGHESIQNEMRTRTFFFSFSHMTERLRIATTQPLSFFFISLLNYCLWACSTEFPNHPQDPIYLLLCCLLEVVDDLLRDVDEAATALEPGPTPRTPGDITEVEEGGENCWHLAAPRPSWFASMRRAVRSLSSSEPPLLPIKEYLQIKKMLLKCFLTGK